MRLNKLVKIEIIAGSPEGLAQALDLFKCEIAGQRWSGSGGYCLDYKVNNTSFDVLCDIDDSTVEVDHQW